MRSITENLIQNGRSVCVKLMKQGIPEYDAEAVAILPSHRGIFVCKVSYTYKPLFSIHLFS